MVIHAAVAFGLPLEFGTHRRGETHNNQCTCVLIHSFAVCDQGADIAFIPPHRYPHNA